MPRRSLMHEHDEVATPEPFRTEIVIGESTLELTLFGGSRVTFEAGKPNQLLTLDINRGRIGCDDRCRREQGTAEHWADRAWTAAELVLLEPGTQCGLEVGQRAPQGRRADAFAGVSRRRRERRHRGSLSRVGRGTATHGRFGRRLGGVANAAVSDEGRSAPCNPQLAFSGRDHSDSR